MKCRSILKVIVVFLTVLSINLQSAYSGLFGHSSHRQRNNIVKIIEVQRVQQFVAIPVNPYYFSYNNIIAQGVYSSGFNNYGIQPVVQQTVQQGTLPYTQAQQSQQAQQQQQAQQKANDERYVTKEEFQDFASKVLKALNVPSEEPETPPPTNTKPTVQEIISILEKNHCQQCHSGPNSKGSNGRSYPIFLEGQLADNLNWDKIATEMMVQSMPPRDSGHSPVPTEEAFRVQLYAHQVSK